jgi:DNA-directed RNA polymerase subunit RPC12/RpoP
MIRFVCPCCNTPVAIPDNLSGQVGRCHACNEKIVAPDLPPGFKPTGPPPTADEEQLNVEEPITPKPSSASKDPAFVEYCGKSKSHSRGAGCLIFIVGVCLCLIYSSYWNNPLSLLESYSWMGPLTWIVPHSWVGIILIVAALILDELCYYIWPSKRLYRCSECKNPVASQDVRICPVCNARFNPIYSGWFR